MAQTGDPPVRCPKCDQVHLHFRPECPPLGDLAAEALYHKQLIDALAERVAILEEEVARMMRDEILELRRYVAKTNYQLRPLLKKLDERLTAVENLLRERTPARSGESTDR